VIVLEADFVKSATAAEHFDRCLGCMACMTACPSGVQYDQLIEAARVWTEEARASGSTVHGVADGDVADPGVAEVRGADGAQGRRDGEPAVPSVPSAGRRPVRRGALR